MICESTRTASEALHCVAGDHLEFVFKFSSKYGVVIGNFALPDFTKLANDNESSFKS